MSQHAPVVLRCKTSARLYTRTRDSRCPSLVRMSSCAVSNHGYWSSEMDAYHGQNRLL